MESICGHEKLPGVDCGVINCKYHSADNACVASSITVENHNAIKRAETFCGTFLPKVSFLASQ